MLRRAVTYFLHLQLSLTSPARDGHEVRGNTSYFISHLGWPMPTSKDAADWGCCRAALARMALPESYRTEAQRPERMEPFLADAYAGRNRMINKQADAV